MYYYYHSCFVLKFIFVWHLQTHCDCADFLNKMATAMGLGRRFSKMFIVNMHTKRLFYNTPQQTRSKINIFGLCAVATSGVFSWYILRNRQVTMTVQARDTRQMSLVNKKNNYFLAFNWDKTWKEFGLCFFFRNHFFTAKKLKYFINKSRENLRKGTKKNKSHFCVGLNINNKTDLVSNSNTTIY